MVLLARSVIPWVWGRKAELNFCLTPAILHMFLNRSEVNELPLSVKRTRGVPCFENTCSKISWAKVSAELEFVAQQITIRVEKSTTTWMRWFPRLVFVHSRVSRQMWANGYGAGSLSVMGGRKFWPRLVDRHLWHVRTYVEMSVFIWYHQKRFLSASRVPARPGWAAGAESWYSCITGT